VRPNRLGKSSFRIVLSKVSSSAGQWRKWELNFEIRNFSRICRTVFSVLPNCKATSSSSACPSKRMSTGDHLSLALGLDNVKSDAFGAVPPSEMLFLCRTVIIFSDEFMMAMRAKCGQASSGLFSDHPKLSGSAVKNAKERWRFHKISSGQCYKSSVTSPRAVPKREGLAAAKKSRWSAEGNRASNTLSFSPPPYNCPQRQRATDFPCLALLTIKSLPYNALAFHRAGAGRLPMRINE
jgi:hypothetical protein